ncbi:MULTISPECIES: helix-turn-helix domain-containing protein [unclassified Dietzia]|uniref:helix-turn-helix domain-containing protein n=1 Tax=unclassified Dietzia TaxID=2617939 RepID=UPI0015FC865B|nr:MULTISPECIES: XRE family transcriptional regulator [unclassified Dietzia]MBB1024178.1 helix-turn-helix domain-containing protein [Dietzia sp. DQ12-76]MBB1026325.1 helix-turn-helix domain-containing protein [Dietzia sp. DQ11-38-2]
MQTSPNGSDQPDGRVATMLEAVGPRLRDLRQRREMKLSDVASATGISVSTLSRLESGHRRPTLDLLIPLAQVYRVALDDVVGAPPTGDPRIHPKPIRKHGRVYLPLTRSGAPVQAFKIILPPRRHAEPAKQATHGGYEWLYVLSGSVDLALGTQVTTLVEGDAAEFDTRQPHCITGSSDTASEVLTLFSPQGEQIHIRD